jgi:phosphoribosylcarboxyaminoimidazole (NCAIR) mutase
MVLEPLNAALLAAKFFGQYDPLIRESVNLFQRKQAEKIIFDDDQLNSH